jgi:hypothetical protein
MLNGRDASSTKSPGDYQMGGFRVKGGAENEGGRGKDGELRVKDEE